VALIAGMTWNRKEFPEFVLKISLFHEHMFGVKQSDVYKKQYKSCIMQIAALRLRLFQFYCYDVYRYGVYTNYFILHRHLTNFIKETVIMQFINVVWMVTERLEYLKKELASYLELRAELSSNLIVNSGVTCFSKN